MKSVIKIRIEGSKNETQQIVEHIQKEFIELEVTGEYELERSKFRTYLDLVL